MADVGNKAVLTRPQWAGVNADADIHIEAWEGDIDGSYRVESMFRSGGLTNFRSVENQSNTFRGDRMSGIGVKGRKSGETLDGQRITVEKFLVTVDTTSYIRQPIDYQDDWTAPDFQKEYSAEHGSAHAKKFDEAHIIQLIKCGAYVPTASLASSFHPGISVTLTGFNALVATANDSKEELRAALVVKTHKDVIATFVKRDMGGSLADFVTLIEPDMFNLLLDHKKLMNVAFNGGNADGGAYAMRRVAWLNGIRVVETPRIPTAAIPAHLLGPHFNLSAAEAKARLIIFNPKKALVTVEAKPMTVRHFDDPLNFQTVLDSFCMYTVGQKRPDSVAIINIE